MEWNETCKTCPFWRALPADPKQPVPEGINESNWPGICHGQPGVIHLVPVPVKQSGLVVAAGGKESKQQMIGMSPQTFERVHTADRIACSLHPEYRSGQARVAMQQMMQDAGLMLAPSQGSA